MPNPIIIDTVFTGDVNDDEDDPCNWKNVTIPSKYEVCSTCQGEGKSSTYLGAYTQSDMDEMSEEFIEDYFAGYYDKPCTECKGNRVILVPDRENADPDLLKEWDKREEENYQTEQMYRMELEAEYGTNY